MLKRAVVSLPSVGGMGVQQIATTATAVHVLPHHGHGRRTTASIQQAVQSAKMARSLSINTNANANSNGNGSNGKNSKRGSAATGRLLSGASKSLAALATMSAVVGGATFYQLADQRAVLAAPGDGQQQASSTPALPPPAWASLPPAAAATPATPAPAGSSSGPVLPPFGGASLGTSAAPSLSPSSPAAASSLPPLSADPLPLPSASSNKPSVSTSSISSAPVEKKKNPGRLEEMDMASQSVLIRQFDPGMKFTLVKNVFPTGVDTQEASSSYQYHIAQGTPLVDKQLTIQTSVSAGDVWQQQDGGSGNASLDVITKLTKEHELAANVDSGSVHGAYTWRAIPKKLTFRNNWTHGADGKNQLVNEVEYRGGEWTAQVRHTNLEDFGVGYLHSVTPRLAMGSWVVHDLEKGEWHTEPYLRYRRTATPSADSDADEMGSFTPVDTVVLHANTQGRSVARYNASYTRSIAPSSALTTTFTHIVPHGESKAALGWRQGGLTFNYGAMIDTQLVVTSSLDIYTNEWSSFNFTGCVNSLGLNEQLAPAMFGVGVTVAA